MNISFEGIGCEVITVKKTSTLKKGDLGYFKSDKTVAPATSSSGFDCKVVAVYEDGTASVQVRGYIEAAYASATPISGVGYQGIACASETVVAPNSSARKYLIISNDTVKHTVGILL